MSNNKDYKKNAQKNKNKKDYEKSQREKRLEELEKSTKSDRYYRNPARTLAGKIIIVILALLMAGSGLFALIYAIVNNK